MPIQAWLVILLLIAPFARAKTDCGPGLLGGPTKSLEFIGSEVYWDKEPVPGLAETEKTNPRRLLLDYFLAHAGQPKSVAEIFAWLWPEGTDVAPAEQYPRVNGRIQKLRDVFYEIDGRFDRIQNVPNVGWLWREFGAEQTANLELGKLRVVDGEFFWDGRKLVGLTYRGRGQLRRALLLRLLATPGVGVSIDELAEAIWQWDAPKTAKARKFAVKALVREIRLAFKAADVTFAQIQPRGGG